MENLSVRDKTSLQIGALFIEEGLISVHDMERALAVQEKSRASSSRTTPRLFGTILCDLNLVTPVDVYYVLKKNEKLTTLEAYLEEKRIVPLEAVRKSLGRSKKTGIPLISVLLEDEILPRKHLARILFDLFHVHLRSISDFVFKGKDGKALSQLISQKEARKNCVIPLMLQGKTLLCGVTDPDNLLFIRDLSNRFPHYRFEALFIPFSGFTWFYKLLYEEAHALKTKKPQPEEKTVELSLLMNYEAVIKDPVIEKDGVLALYERYELLRKLMGLEETQDRQAAFQAFIMEKHESITRKFRCKAIRFSLEKDQGQVMIAAFPKPKEDETWQK